MSEVKLHWYSFSFIGDMLNKPSTTSHTSVYCGYKINNITLKRIAEARTHAGVSDSASMISCCYLGYMTAEEFGDNK